MGTVKFIKMKNGSVVTLEDAANLIGNFARQVTSVIWEDGTESWTTWRVNWNLRDNKGILYFCSVGSGSVLAKVSIERIKSDIPDDWRFQHDWNAWFYENVTEKTKQEA